MLDSLFDVLILTHRFENQELKDKIKRLEEKLTAVGEGKNKALLETTLESEGNFPSNQDTKSNSESCQDHMKR